MRGAWVLVVLLAACSPSKSPAANPSSAMSASKMSDYGQNAVRLAGHIPQCARTQAISLGIGSEQTTGPAPGEIGLATCTIFGHPILLYTWKDSASQTDPEKLMFAGQGVFASGAGWTQITVGGAAPDAQRAIARRVANALGGTVTVLNP
jgi:hypothetical protein